MSKHTPGPWQNVAETWIIAPKAKAATVAMISVREGSPVGETWANASLIAAAPDLLAALEEALPHLSGLSCGDVAREAIKKAKGE